MMTYAATFDRVEHLRSMEAVAGNICALTGLSDTYAGQAIGDEKEDNSPVLTPVLNYKINLPAGVDPMQMLPKLRAIEEEEPQLHIEWDENFKRNTCTGYGTCYDRSASEYN